MRTQRAAPQLGLALLEPLAAGALLCMLSQVLKACAPSSTVGKIVHNRVVQCGENWRRHSVRSALETSVWLATTYWIHAKTSSTVAAACLGAMAGLAVSVVGQLVFSIIDLGDDFTVAWKTPHPQHPAPVDATTLREDNGVTTEVPVYPRVPKSKFPKYPEVPLPKFTVAQVAKHNTRDDCWIILTIALLHHCSSGPPGGVGPLSTWRGRRDRRVRQLPRGSCVQEHAAAVSRWRGHRRRRTLTSLIFVRPGRKCCGISS